MAIYCVVNESTKEAIPVSTGERSAKNYATRHGYKLIALLSEASGMVYRTWEKSGRRWHEVNQ